MKKINTISIIILIWSISIYNLSAQESDLVKLYRDLPDEFFQLRPFDNTKVLFSKKVRTHYLQPKYYNANTNEYTANLFRDIDGYYDNEPTEIDTTSEFYYASDYEPNYFLKINESLGWISYEYDYEGQNTKLDFIVFKGKDSKYLILLEQYLPGMGVPNKQKYSVCELDENNNRLESKDMSFPEFDWKTFYSSKVVKKIRTDLIGDYITPYKVNVEIVSDKLNIFLTPDLNELAWRMSEVLEFDEDNGIGQAFMDTFTKLGIDKLPDAKPVCIPVNKLTK